MHIDVSFEDKSVQYEPNELVSTESQTTGSYVEPPHVSTQDSVPSVSFLEKVILDEAVIGDGEQVNLDTIIDDLTHALFWATTETEEKSSKKSQNESLFRPWAVEEVSFTQFMIKLIFFIGKQTSNGRIKST